MHTIDPYQRRADQLVRWHRERNFSIGGKLRLLERYRGLTDIDVLDMPMSLALAREVVAVEAGFKDWAALEAGAGDLTPPRVDAGKPALAVAVPVLFVRDVAAAAAFYEEKLGFAVDFLHGKPPFYGSVSRDEARLHLRFVHETSFAGLVAREGGLILAMIEVANVKALFDEYESRGVDFAQPLVEQPWGGLEFHVRDRDGNVISFVQYK